MPLLRLPVSGRRTENKISFGVVTKLSKIADARWMAPGGRRVRFIERITGQGQAGAQGFFSIYHLVCSEQLVSITADYSLVGS